MARSTPAHDGPRPPTASARRTPALQLPAARTEWLGRQSKDTALPAEEAARPLAGARGGGGVGGEAEGSGGVEGKAEGAAAESQGGSHPASRVGSPASESGSTTATAVAASPPAPAPAPSSRAADAPSRALRLIAKAEPDGGGGPSVGWDRVARAYPCGRFLAEGGFKRVFLVSDAPDGLEADGGASGRDRSGRGPFAMSVVDVRSLRRKGLEATLATELSVSHQLGELARRGVCPHFLRLHQCFRSPAEPPADEWIGGGGGGSESESDGEGAPEATGARRARARKPARATARRDGSCFQYVVMQYAAGGDMEEACKVQPGGCWGVEELPRLAFQMLYALHVAQARLKLRHYDLKLLNFFLAHAPEHASGGGAGRLRYSVAGQRFELPAPDGPSLVMLADLGTADVCAETLGRPIGAPQFATLENTPPEYLLCGSDARQGYAADLWAMALCLLHLITGKASPAPARLQPRQACQRPRSPPPLRRPRFAPPPLRCPSLSHRRSRRRTRSFSPPSAARPSCAQHSRRSGAARRQPAAAELAPQTRPAPRTPSSPTCSRMTRRACSATPRTATSASLAAAASAAAASRSSKRRAGCRRQRRRP